MADTLFLLMLPFGASEEMAGKWDFPASLCKAKEGILMVNYYASILFLTVREMSLHVRVRLCVCDVKYIYRETHTEKFNLPTETYTI